MNPFLGSGDVFRGKCEQVISIHGQGQVQRFSGKLNNVSVIYASKCRCIPKGRRIRGESLRASLSVEHVRPRVQRVLTGCPRTI